MHKEVNRKMIDMDEADEMNLEVACRETEEYPQLSCHCKSP